ncbi:hypothetical protein C5C86_16600 [Rathayibacter sp. AY1E4]|nr:hypothetical protein C5C86_16600 [Rathayibacter sp. AY1E4]
MRQLLNSGRGSSAGTPSSELSALHFDALSFATVQELSHSTLSATTREQWADDQTERLSSELCALSFELRASGFGLRASGFGLRASGFGLRASGFGLAPPRESRSCRTRR